MNRSSRVSRWVLLGYCVYLVLPLYWLLTMALRSNADIAGTFELLPSNPTFANFAEILTNPVWYQGFVNSLSYVVLNTLISVSVALPAAYVFSRYRFLGDRQLFFWLLTNRMAPPAVFLLPFSSFIPLSACLIRPWRWLWHTACLQCLCRFGFWKVLCLACQQKLMIWRGLTATASGSFLPVFSCRSIGAPLA